MSLTLEEVRKNNENHARKLAESGHEFEVFSYIEFIGRNNWLMGHERKKGNITDKDWEYIEQEVKMFYEVRNNLVKAVAPKFGIDIDDDKGPNSFGKWYTFWKDWKDGLSDEQWKRLQNAICNKEPIYQFLPNTNWRGRTLPLKEKADTILLALANEVDGGDLLLGIPPRKEGEKAILPLMKGLAETLHLACMERLDNPVGESVAALKRMARILDSALKVLDWNYYRYLSPGESTDVLHLFNRTPHYRQWRIAEEILGRSPSMDVEEYIRNGKAQNLLVEIGAANLMDKMSSRIKKEWGLDIGDKPSDQCEKEGEP
jgi:hypothetical protein